MKPHPWKPADATDCIREIASGEYDLLLTKHARDQMRERSLFVGDIRNVLKNGFVYDEPQNSTRPGIFKYLIEGLSPNFGNRTIRIVLLHQPNPLGLKIVTIMWKDENTQGG